MTTILNDATGGNIAGLVTTPEPNVENTNKDMEVFLGLLLTQLQNQDPLDPVDTTEYTSQLVQYSTLEQAMILNENTRVQNEIEASENRQGAISYLGRDVQLSTSNSVVQNGVATWNFTVGASTGDARIVIQDANGNTVYRSDESLDAGTYPFSVSLDELSDSVGEGEVLELFLTTETGNGQEIASSANGLINVESVDVSGADSDRALLQAGELSFDENYILQVLDPSRISKPAIQTEASAYQSQQAEDDGYTTEDFVDDAIDVGKTIVDIIL